MTERATTDAALETIGYFGVLLHTEDGIRAAHHVLAINDALRSVSSQIRVEADRLGKQLVAETVMTADPIGGNDQAAMTEFVVKEFLLRSALDDDADSGTVLAYTLSQMTGARYFVLEGSLGEDGDPAVSELHRLEAETLEDGQQAVLGLLEEILDDAEDAPGCSPDDPPSELCDACLLNQGLAYIEELIARGMLQVVVQTPAMKQECEVVSANTDEWRIDLRIREQFGKEIKPEGSSRAKQDRSKGGGMVH